MRRTAVAAVCSLLVMIVVSTAHASNHKSTSAFRCGLGRQTHVVLVDTQAEIYETLLQEPDTNPLVEYHGCVFGSGRSFSLGNAPGKSTCDAYSCNGITHLTLTGAIAADESFAIAAPGLGRQSASYYVDVEDLRTGRVLHSVTTGVPLAPIQPKRGEEAETAYKGVGSVVSLLVKSNGAVAWIAEDYERSTRDIATSRLIPFYDLYALDKTGERLLASGMNLDPHSLAIAGSRLYWTQEGKPYLGALN